MENATYSKTYLESLLGSPSKINHYIHSIRHFYNIEANVILVLEYDMDDVLKYLKWYKFGKCNLLNTINEMNFEPTDLEKIFDELPLWWKDIIIFNMDLFKYDGYI